jgi:ribosomal protein S18 acetylase RimI-like enzyme
MEIREVEQLEAMFESFDLAKNLYPRMSLEVYKRLLTDAFHSGFLRQIQVFEGENMIGLCGYWIGTKVWCGKYMELDHFVVHPDYRSHGIGDRMVNELAKKAEAMNCQMIALDAYTDNFKAHKFFVNHGFVPRGFHFIRLIGDAELSR